MARRDQHGRLPAIHQWQIRKQKTPAIELRLHVSCCPDVQFIAPGPPREKKQNGLFFSMSDAPYQSQRDLDTTAQVEVTDTSRMFVWQRIFASMAVLTIPVFDFAALEHIRVRPLPDAVRVLSYYSIAFAGFLVAVAAVVFKTGTVGRGGTAAIVVAGLVVSVFHLYLIILLSGPLV